MNLHHLQDRFPAEDIEWRIARAGYTQKGTYYGIVLAYLTNRAIMRRLDEVCGPENWRNEYREWEAGNKRGVLCGISIRINGEWITKWDGAENTDIESVKGGLSDAMKRAGVQWGIGRYLYNLDENFAIVSDNGKYFASGNDKSSGRDYRFKWNPPSLPAWALPSSNKDPVPTPPKQLTPLRPATPVPQRRTDYVISQAPAAKRP